MSSDLQIVRVDVSPLNVPLIDPFVIASTRLDHVENVAVKVELNNGMSGWGEIGVLFPVTAEDQSTALATGKEAATSITGQSVEDWMNVASQLAEQFPEYPGVRAGLEMAMVDAYARARGLALFQYFGGASDQVETDITIPLCDPDKAEALAVHYKEEGFSIIKTKVGRNSAEDLERLNAIRKGHPHCRFTLDANGGYTAEEALAVIKELESNGFDLIMLEQPVAREDWEGLGKVTRESTVPVAADESCRSRDDALKIVHGGLAHILNIKLAKCGVAEGLDIVSIGRDAGLELMIGEMIETRLSTGFSAHFAAGTGCFDHIDLDTPFLLKEDPIKGGYRSKGPVYYLDGDETGHGATFE